MMALLPSTLTKLERIYKNSLVNDSFKELSSEEITELQKIIFRLIDISHDQFEDFIDFV